MFDLISIGNISIDLYFRGESLTFEKDASIAKTLGLAAPENLVPQLREVKKQVLGQILKKLPKDLKPL